MSMKEAFDIYFEELQQSYRKQWGTLPLVVYSEELEKCGLILPDSKDEEGYAQWKPLLQTEAISFSKIEQALGFAVNQQIKDFVTTYWFCSLDGKLQSKCGTVVLTLNGITPFAKMDQLVIGKFDRNGAHYLEDAHYFLIGSFCAIGGNDSFLVQVNNETSEVTAVEVMDMVSIKLADSIEELLYNMKGIY